MAGKKQRVVDIAFLNSGLDIDSIEYNPASGAEKALLVGPRLLPIPTAAGWTTNIVAAKSLPYLGALMYIYNNSGTAAAVTVGQDNTIAAQAIGAVDANGNVGVACPPNAYTYVSLGSNQWIIGSTATLIAYIVEDPTRIIQETPPRVAQNINGFVPPVNS
jgi:hypothetical protein